MEKYANLSLPELFGGTWLTQIKGSVLCTVYWVLSVPVQAIAIKPLNILLRLFHMEQKNGTLCSYKLCL